MSTTRKGIAYTFSQKTVASLDVCDIVCDIMKQIAEALAELENPKNVRFKTVLGICESFFGKPRIRGSHHIFKMPWPGDPRINLQKERADAKPYQVRDVRRALERLQRERNEKKNDKKRG